MLPTVRGARRALPVTAPTAMRAVLAAAFALAAAASSAAAQVRSDSTPGSPAVAPIVAPVAPLTGFAPDRLAGQQRCEARLQELPTPAAFREHLRRITAEPHPTGSAAQLRVAEYLAATMQRAGLRVERAEYDVFLPQLEGLVNEVEIVTPERMPLRNQEPALPEDPFTAHPDLLPGWNAFSGSGDVTARVVYANFGRPEDFAELARRGIDVNGAVVIARYGGNFRGHKVQFAQENGAAAVIMFNDPGFAEGEPYPDGPDMTPWTIQRGSVLTLPWTGDPLTPFEPALPLDTEEGRAVRRLDPDSVAFHRIPVLPIGYGAAQQIMQWMTGEEAPPSWRGGISATYRLTGGDSLTVRVHVRQQLDFTRAVNVIGWLDGAEHPDEWIVLGSHYDPWSFGAHDPNGGTAMLLTLAEALGQLARDGCRPRRSIAIAHWDAEEYGIIGSTEWVEHHRDALTTNAVAYINADGAVTGPTFSTAASPSLKLPIVEAARAVRYGNTDSTVYQVWTSAAEPGAQPRIGNLGGGSDHVGFYTHVGVPSAGLSLGGANGIYHSNYDTFAFFERFSDPDFIHGATLARLDGVLALRLANADVIPYDVERYGRDIVQHAAGLVEIASARGVTVDLAPLTRAAQSLHFAAEQLIAAREEWLQQDVQYGAPRTAALNSELIGLEKAFIDERGLQDRPWSRSLYASPDPFSGYASWMLPGLRYEIETRDGAGIAEWQDRYVDALEALEERIRGATAIIRWEDLPGLPRRQRPIRSTMP